MYSSNPFSNEEERRGVKFVTSFSTGKDSTLAIYRCKLAGMVPTQLITTMPEEGSRSWFHKTDEFVLKDISKALEIPISFIKTSPEKYEINFELALLEAKKRGAEVAVFGDIDIEEHLEWCFDRCEKVGIKAYFPLWQAKREAIVKEFLDVGFKAKIISVNHKKLENGFLGEVLSKEIVKQMSELGVDVCGEGGEYHTTVFDGPIFKYPVVL